MLCIKLMVPCIKKLLYQLINSEGEIQLYELIDSEINQDSNLLLRYKRLESLSLRLQYDYLRLFQVYLRPF